MQIGWDRQSMQFFLIRIANVKQILNKVQLIQMAKKY